ncbi:MAG: hypothetical protein JWR69_2175, partial [Pedosphaera sp.]|nr:hypothetical protein [Pedosphaera sp.]
IQEAITVVGKHMFGEEFEVERPISELTEEEKQAKWKKQAEDEQKYKEKIYAEQAARNALALEELRQRKAAGLPPPPNLNGEWPRGL